jgi:hypothetical protein
VRRVAWEAKPLGRKKNHVLNSSCEPHRQEGAGGLLLVAAANETGLLAQLETALASCSPLTSQPLLPSALLSGRKLLLTLLFLNVIGLRRTRDLRCYTGEALGLLTGRKRAYGYWHTERFLTQFTNAGGAEALTTALGKWTAQLWQSASQACQEGSACYYIDGHRKPVYADSLLPRGRIGRSGKILGCRALVLFHDPQGHPRLAITHRGDQHLTIGLPQILTRYEQAGGVATHARVIVDREGMAAPFLRDLAAAGHSVVTLLRRDQYRGIESFTQVGTFVPLEQDRHGQVVREVAPACFALPLPDQAGQFLPLRVALVRDWRRQVPSHEQEEETERDRHKPGWWQEDWKAEPTPALPTTAKLVPIVTTADTIDAVELVETYTRRWPVQENVIKDFLLPLGLDTNHGYAKTSVENSEVAKRRTALENRLANVKRWADGAGERSRRARKRHHRLEEQTRIRTNDLDRVLKKRQDELVAQGVAAHLLQREIKERKAAADAKIEQMHTKMWRADEQCNQELGKQERYCKEQCDLLRALEDLRTNERPMYELDNRKDQVMTVCKLALANLAMWTRDHYFPATYAHATWERLAPFFQLPGVVRPSRQLVSVELLPFNDRQLNRDLTALCQRVNEVQPRLPDGRLLLFTVKETSRPILHGQKRRIA